MPNPEQNEPNIYQEGEAQAPQIPEEQGEVKPQPRPEEGEESKPEAPVEDPEKAKEIERLKKVADQWIEICQSSIKGFYDRYNIEAIGEDIRSLGAEAPKQKVDHYQWLTTKIANHKLLIERLQDEKRLLDMGVTKDHLGRSREESMNELIDSLY